MAELFFIYGGALIAAAIGVGYWAGSSSQSPVWQRGLASAYGPAICLVFIVAALLWPETHRYKAEGVRAFLQMQLLPLGLLVYSLGFYPGPRRLHLLLVPLGLVAWLWTFAFGYIAINGM